MKKKFIKALCAVLAAGLLVVSLAGCSGINGEETAMVINGEEVSVGLSNFLLRYQQSQTVYYMAMLGMGTDGMWSSVMDESTGETYAQTFKEATKNSLVKLVVTKQKAEKEYGIKITEDEEKAISEAAASFLAANPQAKENFGASEEQIKEMLRLETYSQNIQPFLTGDVDREVSDDEAAQSRVIYCRIKKAGEDEEDAEATNKESKEQIAELLKEIKDQPELTADAIQELGKLKNENFFATEYTFGEDDTSLDSTVRDAALSVEDGKWYGDVIDTTDFYYIVKMVNKFDREATDTKKESIIKERENTAVQECFTKWAEEAKVEVKSGWDKLTVRDEDVYTVKVNV